MEQSLKFKTLSLTPDYKMIETELKLLLDPKYIDKVKQHPLLLQPTDSQVLHSTYFDTVEYDLLQNKIGFRIRHIGDERIQTLKTAGNALGGLHTRQEWETSIIGDTPNYEQIPAEALAYLPANFTSIQPIFTTEFNRITWLITVDNSTIEIALDQGEVKTATNSKPINEIELELKSGSAVTLYKVALILLDDIPFTIENKSKAALGYALCKPQPLQFYKAGLVDLNSDMTAEQTLIHIIWHYLQHLQSNEDMVLYGKDSEGVHQMRLASRNLLSGLNLYKSFISRNSYKKLQREIKWINSVLIIAVDWDVFASNLQPAQLQNKSLGLQIVTKQVKAYEQVRDMLRSPRYIRTLLLLSKWLLQKPWRKDLGAEELLRLDSPMIDVTE